ncbi:hypothetical protein C2E23DRAFT_808657 [Lenzites betulinus]|nr:hypothetical protein C2E23DRAFT_808657 [Lenzites betulinus]
MGPASRKGKPQFCKLCVDAQGGRVPMKGHKLQCPARAAQLADVSVPLSLTPSSPPNVNAPSSPSPLHTPSTMTTPSPSPATSPMNDHMGSPISPADTSTFFDLNDILNDLHTLIPALHDNFTFPASSPSPYTPTNLTLNTPTDLLTPPRSGFFMGGAAAEPPMTAGADLDGLAAMDWTDDVDPPALTRYDFGQFFNIVTPPSTLSERDIHTDHGDAQIQTMVTDLDADPGHGAEEHAQDYQFPSPVTGGDAAAAAAASEPSSGFVMHGDHVSASVESASIRVMDVRPPDAPIQVRPPTSRAPSLRAAGVRKFSATAITDRKKVSKQYAFLHKVQRRKNEHSRMAANILKQVCYH